jgi:hypothetical protein
VGVVCAGVTGGKVVSFSLATTGWFGKAASSGGLSVPVEVFLGGLDDTASVAGVIRGWVVVGVSTVVSAGALECVALPVVA